jgi:hypothetical protein
VIEVVPITVLIIGVPLGSGRYLAYRETENDFPTVTRSAAADLAPHRATSAIELQRLRMLLELVATACRATGASEHRRLAPGDGHKIAA